MLVNQKKIQEGLIQYTQKVLDGLLSEMPSQLGSLPSVIKDRTNGPRPDYPYVVVDRTYTLKGAGDSSWLRNQYINDDGQIVYVHEHRVGVNITCYGEDADIILSQLQVSFVDDYFRNQLNKMTDAVFQICSDISENPQFLNTDYIDGAEMDVYFTAVSEWSPIGRVGSCIDRVEVTGDYEVSEMTSEIIVDINENN